MTEKLNIGNIDIDLLDDRNNAWGKIKCTESSILIGMYEDGKVAKELFMMDKKQAEQLGKMLLLLSKS